MQPLQVPAAGGDALGDSLVVAGVQSLDGEQQVIAQERAKASSPEAVKAREESRTKSRVSIQNRLGRLMVKLSLK